MVYVAMAWNFGLNTLQVL